MPRYRYGGQALIEGVLMRGRFALAVALRHPDGSIVWATERLDAGLRARRALRLPLVRGLVLLYDTLVTGTRWLVRSATVAAAVQPEEAADVPPASDRLVPDGRDAVASDPAPGARTANAPAAAETGLGSGFGAAVGLTMAVTLLAAIGIFFLLPLLLASATVGRVDNGLGLQLTEGLIRVLLFVGYLLLIARAPDIHRVFQYHGAEHMAIHALEAGDPLTRAAVRKYPTAHPRCGTEFLVVVLIISIVAFALVGKQTVVLMIATRILLIPVIAAVSYELLQFGARHRDRAAVRWLWAPGIWVQAITTAQPTDDMIEVAIVSLRQALLADGQAVPEGSSDLPARPMDPLHDPLLLTPRGPAAPPDVAAGEAAAGRLELPS